jgi:hypothetical protein
MKTHQWILPVAMQAQIGPTESPIGATRTDPPGRAARGVLILALVLGGLGTEAAAMSGHGTGNHVSAHHAAGNIRPADRAYLASSSHAIRHPWMY